MSALEELKAGFARAHVTRWVGAELSFEDRSAVVRLPLRSEHIQAHGVAHGAILTFVADTSAWFTAAAASGKNLTTASFTINLLSAAKEGDTLLGRGTLVKAGRRLVVVRSTVTRGDGELVAEGLFTHAVLGP